MRIITDFHIDEMISFSGLNSRVLKTDYKLSHKVSYHGHWTPKSIYDNQAPDPSSEYQDGKLEQPTYQSNLGESPQ
jgi:hypothetical protein